MTLRALVVVGLFASTPAFARPGLGVIADVGAPDGATAAVALRPSPRVTLHAGVGYNYISRSVRIGATFTPFNTIIRPTLSVDYGRFPEGDANPLARMVSGDDTFHAEPLERVGYDFANAHVGFELGRRFTFFMRAGATRIRTEVPDRANDSDTIMFVTDPRATVWTVSARLGFILYVN